MFKSIQEGQWTQNMRLGRSKNDLGAHLGLPRPPKLEFGAPPRAMAGFGPSRKQGGSYEGSGTPVKEKRGFRSKNMGKPMEGCKFREFGKTHPSRDIKDLLRRPPPAGHASMQEPSGDLARRRSCKQRGGFNRSAYSAGL